MKKDKEWLKEELMGLKFRISEIGKVRLREVFELVDQLGEPKKPVIPQFVADYIESQDDPIYEMCINYEMWGVNGGDGTTSFTREVAELFDDHINVENYYRACTDGYEVEKEQKYILSINITHKASNTNYETFLNKRGIFHSMKNESFNSEEFNWTEEEIKDLESGEILFEHFATKVEGLEE